jgi:hypothetical protein
MLDVTEGDLETFGRMMRSMQDMADVSGYWRPTLILVHDNDKITISIDENGQAILTEAYNVPDELKRGGLL